MLAQAAPMHMTDDGSIILFLPSVLLLRRHDVMNIPSQKDAGEVAT